MRGSTRGFRLGVRCGIVAGLAFCSAGLALAGGRWHVADTTHYEVRTDVSEGFTKLVAQHMEAIHGEYEQRFRGWAFKKHERFQVKVFSRREDYDAAVQPALTGSSGAFISNARLLAACREDRTGEEVFRTLYHEGFHQFLFSCVARNVPLWLNEGFAEYFSEATWNGSRFVTGQVPCQRLCVLKKAIEEGTFIPLAELFAMDNSRWLSNAQSDETRSSLQYSEAWSVVHFLLHAQGGRHRPVALGYLKRISEGADREAAFVKSFGSNVDALQRAWRAYVMNLEPTPDEVCRKNIGLIAFLALSYYGDLDRFQSLSELRRDLMDGRRIEWEATASDGERITWRDKRRIASLFRCPYDSSPGPISYVLARRGAGGRPEIYCTHHPGTVMRAYYVSDPEQGMSVRVERIVRATLPRELVAKLRAAARQTR